VCHLEAICAANIYVLVNTQCCSLGEDVADLRLELVSILSNTNTLWE
jgi:hypothetical protein